jgi:hypothetical protein
MDELDNETKELDRPAGLNLSTMWTRLPSSSSEKFLEPQALSLGFDLSESRVIDDDPVEDVLDLQLIISFPTVQQCQ